MAAGIRFGCMYARWGSFAVGLGLMLAPVALGYRSPGVILHDVALGLFACVATLAALEWPPARVVLALPAAWLVYAARGRDETAAAVVAATAGALLLVLCAIPSAPRLRARGRADAGARA